ncbi:MAG TPA: SRPBCC family protein [Acidimicrobiales bacterium]|nr:SRPBCC family protein [Acidimicrobiales bacterium]
MGHIRVSTFIRAPRLVVWRAVRDIGSHVRWMHDAEAIRITSSRATGLGTTFECATRVGPLRLSDTMEVVEWKERRTIGIRHTGLVQGHGRFTLRLRPGGTLFTWEERLRFPWWMGGPVGSVVSKPVLRSIWKRNLATLKEMVESAR